MITRLLVKKIISELFDPRFPRKQFRLVNIDQEWGLSIKIHPQRNVCQTYHMLGNGKANVL